jgi:cell division protease FtsH
MTRPELESRIAVLLGGRAAEQLVFGQLSTGAADDLAKATDIAMSMVTRYAMVPELGHVAYEPPPTGFLPGLPSPRRHGERTAREIDCAVRAILDAAFERARGLLERNRELLLESAEILLREETLDEAQLRPILSRLGPAPRWAPGPQPSDDAIHAA